MFKLYDNRTELYQWDLNRKVIVEDNTVTEVHFCNKTDDFSLVVPTYRLADTDILVADIPNILLQDNWNIRCYAYCTDYTKVEALFKVHPRTKPADYAYTETEVRTWNELLSIIEDKTDLTNYYTKTETDTAIQTAVDAIDIPEVDFTGYATEQYVQDQIDAIPEVDLSEYAKQTWVQEQNYLTEHQSLDNYYTKEQTEEAIYNSKDAYYIDFTNATNEQQDATEEMIAFLDAMTANQNVCAHIKDSSSTRYRPAAVTFRGSLDGTRSVNLMQSDIVLEDVYAGEATEYSRYVIFCGFTGRYYYYKELNTLSVLLATQDYVDEAIAEVETGDVDLSGYYTKEEVDTLINNIDECDTYFFNPDELVWDKGYENSLASADEEMVEFATRFIAGERVQLAITYNSLWRPALVGLSGSNIVIYRGLDTSDLFGDTTIQAYRLFNQDTYGWVFAKDSSYSNQLANKEYVDTAITNAFNGIATAEEGSY